MRDVLVLERQASATIAAVSKMQTLFSCLRIAIITVVAFIAGLFAQGLLYPPIISIVKDSVAPIGWSAGKTMSTQCAILFHFVCSLGIGFALYRLTASRKPPLEPTKIE